MSLQNAAARNFQGIAVVIAPRYGLSRRDDAYQTPIFFQTYRKFVSMLNIGVSMMFSHKTLRFPQCYGTDVQFISPIQLSLRLFARDLNAAPV
jgi:hypothetical protein